MLYASPPSQGAPCGPAAQTAAPDTLRRTIHRVNNHLAAVSAFAEAALAKGETGTMRRALEVILAQGQSLEAFLREARREAQL